MSRTFRGQIYVFPKNERFSLKTAILSFTGLGQDKSEFTVFS